MKQEIRVVSVPVRDQDAAKAFYQNVLGFQLERDNPMGPDSRWIQLRPPGSEATIALVTWFKAMPPGSMQGLVLGVDDIAAYHAELTARGLSVTPIAEEPWGLYASFQDPDGNGWVLQQDPEWSGDVAS
jgi:catechol 2,3-dioxygenase-like lactoylglutathione lyase family enzyme